MKDSIGFGLLAFAKAAVRYYVLYYAATPNTIVLKGDVPSFKIDFVTCNRVFRTSHSTFTKLFKHIAAYS